MSIPALSAALKPRASVYDQKIRDVVYDLNRLSSINPEEFFAENYVTAGMKTLLSEGFKRLDGRAPDASGVFLLSQSMGGGKTHNLIALGLLAKSPWLREKVDPSLKPVGEAKPVRVATFSRDGDTVGGVIVGFWGALAQQLGRLDAFSHLQSPFRAPSASDWVKVLSGEPTLILLDELPPYFEAAGTTTLGAGTLATLATTALANLFVALGSGSLPNACVVLTDLAGTAFGAGSAAISAALADAQGEARRVAQRIDPVNLQSDELYSILRRRLFESEPDEAVVKAAAAAYGEAVKAANQQGFTSLSDTQAREGVAHSYPFHPSLRDLFARSRENPGFQQTRALLRLMRDVVNELWTTGEAGRETLIGPQLLNYLNERVVSEIRQINATLENAVAHDIESTDGLAVAQRLAVGGSALAVPLARIVYLSSLSLAANPLLGLSVSEIGYYLAAPGADLSGLPRALEDLQAGAWYLHSTPQGNIYFRNVENVNAKILNLALTLPANTRELEVQEQLGKLFAPKVGDVYQKLMVLEPQDAWKPDEGAVLLVILKPDVSAKALDAWWAAQKNKNRVLFLSCEPSIYPRVSDAAALVNAVKSVLTDFAQRGISGGDPQYVQAQDLQQKYQSRFYFACRDAFTTLRYPMTMGLATVDVTFSTTGKPFDGEEQIRPTLEGVSKFVKANLTDGSFRQLVERLLWPADSKETPWADIKRRAAEFAKWPWHHPGALDDLRKRMTDTDQWREIGGGFLERGPFAPPAPSVQWRKVSRDDQTGRVQWAVQGQNAARVHYREGATAGPDDPVLEARTLETTALKLSFLPVGPDGQLGAVVTAENEITVLKHLDETPAGRTLTLKAVPSGSIKYATGSASPEASGRLYEAPLSVPRDGETFTYFAEAEGLKSTRYTDVISGGVKPDLWTPDPGRAADWRHDFSLGSNGEAYAFLDAAAANDAELADVQLTVTKTQINETGGAKTGGGENWFSLQTGAGQFMPASRWAEEARRLADQVGPNTTTLDVHLVRVPSGGKLTALATALRVKLEHDKVRQP